MNLRKLNKVTSNGLWEYHEIENKNTEPGFEERPLRIFDIAITQGEAVNLTVLFTTDERDEIKLSVRKFTCLEFALDFLKWAENNFNSF